MDHAGLHNGNGAKAAHAQYQGVEFKLRAPQTPGAYPVSLRWNMHYTYDQAIEGMRAGGQHGHGDDITLGHQHVTTVVRGRRAGRAVNPTYALQGTTGGVTFSGGSSCLGARRTRRMPPRRRGTSTRQSPGGIRSSSLSTLRA
jgi:hypothetical protein